MTVSDPQPTVPTEPEVQPPLTPEPEIKPADAPEEMPQPTPGGGGVDPRPHDGGLGGEQVGNPTIN